MTGKTQTWLHTKKNFQDSIENVPVSSTCDRVQKEQIPLIATLLASAYSADISFSKLRSISIPWCGKEKGSYVKINHTNIKTVYSMR